MNRIMVWIVFGMIVFSPASVRAEMNRHDGQHPNSSSELVWYDSLDAGWEESRRRGVPMVIFITSERCKYCQAMKRDTWCDAQVRRQLATNFVPIRLTPQDNARVLNRITVTSYPTTLIGVPQGKIIDHRIGYQPPGSIKQLLSKTRRR